MVDGLEAVSVADWLKSKGLKCGVVFGCEMLLDLLTDLGLCGI